MKQSTDLTLSEPDGIVISGGHSASEAAPRFSAYVWAPAPDEEAPKEVHAA
jgi:GMP synthase-like glutamine amidotransferase